MRLPDQIRAVACTCWIGVLGLGMYVGAQDAPKPAGSPGFASDSPEGVVESCPSLPACGLLEPVARSQGVSSASGRVAQDSLSGVLLEEPVQGHYLPYVVTAYAVGCILPKFGPEPPAQRMASGEWPIAGLHVAADPSLAFGTVIEAVWQGLPSRLIVGDRGRAIRGRRLDLFVRDCDTARAWGRRTVMARVVEGE